MKKTLEERLDNLEVDPNNPVDEIIMGAMFGLVNDIPILEALLDLKDKNQKGERVINALQTHEW